MTPGDALYDSQMEPRRLEVLGDRGLGRLLEPSSAPELLLLFLLEFSCHGIAMTEPVPRWLERAGQRCIAVGLPEVGATLQLHANHEADHHLYMQADAHRAATRLAGFGIEVDVPALLERAPLPAAHDYVELHEVAIDGPLPYLQVAIECEIGRLAEALGRPILARLVSSMGRDFVRSLSFLPEHVEVDVGFRAASRRLLAQVIEARPRDLPALVGAGERALDCYRRFLTSCLELATERLAEAAPRPAASSGGISPPSAGHR